MTERWKRDLDRWLTTPPEDYDDHTGQYDADYDEPTYCEWCGEPLKDGDECAEMYLARPPAHDGERDRFCNYNGTPLNVIVHAQCGLSNGFEVA